MQIRKLTMMSIASAALATYLSVAPPARADDVKPGDLVISQAWSRATPKGAKTGGGYFTIKNKGSAPDRLTGGSADVAGSVQVHEMSMEGGVMKMRPVEKGLTIEPGKTVKLAPGGYHLMMMDLNGGELFNAPTRLTASDVIWQSHCPNATLARC
ncbi:MULTISPECIES: copper chaperone PCu(A)C [Bradyrhizobium]|uniref:copper chaperone PCu(A)C n=1 Tax=Bradyrhizobium elkanii TaxID=29448 RepID=UPI0004212789|nr:copper chaperone PCu(A)C [Bradyrhizobium elkanii]